MSTYKEIHYIIGWKLKSPEKIDSSDDKFLPYTEGDPDTEFRLLHSQCGSFDDPKYFGYVIQSIGEDDSDDYVLDADRVKEFEGCMLEMKKAYCSLFGVKEIENPKPWIVQTFN